MRQKKRSRLPWLIVLGVVVGGGYGWLRERTEPMPSGEDVYVHFDKSEALEQVLTELQTKGVVRDSGAARIAGWFYRAPSRVQGGTYKVAAGMDIGRVFDALRHPLRQMVRVPDTNWAQRNAHYLAERDILKADEYLTLVHQPAAFQKDVSFPLPKDSLEGYLYPDTYDLPPLIGARQVIERQLKTFDKRVWQGLNKPKDLDKVLIKASLVQLEAGTTQERRMIAGVIENRLAKGMRLEVDASLLYGIQKWRRLTYSDYRTIDSPYNLYTHDGLPPGPICSPTTDSIEAVLNPIHHDKLYYITMPNGQTLFSATLAEHEHNIRVRDAIVRSEKEALRIR